MHKFYRGVNEAFTDLVELFNSDGDYGECDGITKKDSRNGPVIQIEEAVTITYEKPLERVLFNQARDANPFFHLYEALWMLAGRNDVAPLAYYAKQIKEYSDDNETLNGAYGWRWKHNYINARSSDKVEHIDGVTYGKNKSDMAVTYQVVDQLQLLIQHLKNNPSSRRAVLQMWNVEDDLLKIEQRPEYSGNFYNSGLKFPPSKDVCCNTAVYFSIRDNRTPTDMDRVANVVINGVLDMTVTNRSNDMIWGMLGANVVHFSFLQEYMAAHIGVEVGVYNQFSNNLHVYESNWKPKEWLAAYERQHRCEHCTTQDPRSYAGIPADACRNCGKKAGRHHLEGPGEVDFYTESWGKEFKTVPLIKNPTQFDKELPEFVERHSKLADLGEYKEPFLRDVAQPMCIAFHWHKKKLPEYALEALKLCKADDWRIAATQWINRRTYTRSKTDVSE